MIGSSFDGTKTLLHHLLVCAEVLLQRIEAATGNTVTCEPELIRAGVVAEAHDEGPESWDTEEPLEQAVL